MTFYVVEFHSSPGPNKTHFPVWMFICDDEGRWCCGNVLATSIPSHFKYIKHLLFAQQCARVVTQGMYNGYRAGQVLV